MFTLISMSSSLYTKCYVKYIMLINTVIPVWWIGYIDDASPASRGNCRCWFSYFLLHRSVLIKCKNFLYEEENSNDWYGCNAVIMCIIMCLYKRNLSKETRNFFLYIHKLGMETCGTTYSQNLGRIKYILQPSFLSGSSISTVLPPKSWGDT